MEHLPDIPQQQIENWQRYYEQTRQLPPAKLLVEALQYVRAKDAALDFGAGAQVDTQYLLDQGFKKVIAVDQMPLVAIDNAHYEFVQAGFEQYVFPGDFFDLVNAEKALPFVRPEEFTKVWQRLRNSLIRGGVFSGQFFGVNDTWSSDKTMNFHNLEGAKILLEGMEILKLEERERDGTTAAGAVKHWHVFNIIARA